MFHISYFTLLGNEICLRYVRIAGGCFGSFQGIVKHTLKLSKHLPPGDWAAAKRLPRNLSKPVAQGRGIWYNKIRIVGSVNTKRPPLCKGGWHGEAVTGGL